MMHKFAIRTIKSFIRDYGVTVFWITLNNIATDLVTGDVTPDETKVKIKKAVLMPETLARKFSYDLSYIAANKNFVYGGFYDRGDGALIFLSKHLPKDRNLNDFIEIGTNRFEVKNILIHPLGFIGINFTHVVGADVA
ncbi:MAG: hypothetical protein QQN65_03250 [Nitrosopumilus sp.]